MRKDPLLACLLNLILVGTGHMYLGQISKGLLVMVGGILLTVITSAILTIPYVIWAMYSAHSAAIRLNEQGEACGEVVLSPSDNSDAS